MVMIWWRAGIHDLRTPGKTWVRICEVKREKAGRHTGLFVDTQLGNSRTGTPGGQLGRFVHQDGQGIVFAAQSQDDAQVMRQPLEAAYILADQLGRAMVVVGDGKDAVDDSPVGLEQAHHDAEDDVGEGVGQMVQLGLEE